MSKISNAIMMIEYLNTGNKYSVKELSNKLGITERMVRYYKDILQDAGIYIDSFMGPKGGYFLTKTGHSYKQFTKYDINLLESTVNILDKNNFEFIEDYKKMITKVKEIFEIENERNKFTTDLDMNDSSKMTAVIQKALDSKERIKIVYQDISGSLNERWIHPVYLFKYDNKIFLTAFCEARNDIRHFELLRIKEIK